MWPFWAATAAARPRCFAFSPGRLDMTRGEVYVNPNKKLGHISQIPRYPAGYTVEEVLRSAFRKLVEVRRRMEELEGQMTASTPQRHPERV